MCLGGGATEDHMATCKASFRVLGSRALGFEAAERFGCGDVEAFSSGELDRTVCGKQANTYPWELS